jgi:hypothetical protein
MQETLSPIIIVILYLVHETYAKADMSRKLHVIVHTRLALFGFSRRSAAQ